MDQQGRLRELVCWFGWVRTVPTRGLVVSAAEGGRVRSSGVDRVVQLQTEPVQGGSARLS